MSEKKITRRKYLKYVGGAAGLALAAAAGYGISELMKPPVMPTNSTALMPTNSTAPVVTGVTNLTFQWDMLLQDMPAAWLKWNAQQFNQANPNLNIELAGLNDWDVDDKLTHMVAAGDVYDASEIYSTPSDLMEFVNEGAIQPLDGFITADERAKIFPAYLQALSMVPSPGPTGGTTTTTGPSPSPSLYALPGQVICDAMFYNTRMFSEAGLTGPPDTIDDFEEAVKETSKPPTQYGWGMENWRPYYIWDDWFYARGGHYFNADGTCALNSSVGVDQMEWLKNLRDSGWIYPDYLKSYEWRTNFGLEKIALWCDGSWMVGLLTGTFPNMTNWDVAFLPRMKGGSIRGYVAPEPISIFAQSKHQQDIWKWLEQLWFNDESCIKYSQAEWGLPWRADWQSIGVKITDWEKRGYMDQAAGGWYVPHDLVPENEFVSDTLAEAFQEAMAATKTCQQALDDAAANINKTLSYASG
jgi:multiple sugar transport system substrate-binding protein